MRYLPAALALSAILAVTASVGRSAPPAPLEPRAAALVAEGRTALSAGDVDKAVGDFESALTVQPGHVAIYLNLAEATRKQGMQGKALHYYREALTLDPQNTYAIAGEGEALVEKGAVEKARRNLARLQELCGGTCAPAQQLAAAIQKGPAPQVVTADQVKSQPVVSEN
ncbi:MAG: tetratricopeptide repeat protein [Proteobacteria bacterium]|nr:tetratricopeptide repeat protein [Pseudomonadota bacterium]